MTEDQIAQARQLYKPSQKVEQLVLEICDLFDKPQSNGVTINGLRFDSNFLELCGLNVKEVVREDSHSALLIHWFPRYDISKVRDPFCSAFILRYNTLMKLKKTLEEVMNKITVK